MIFHLQLSFSSFHEIKIHDRKDDGSESECVGSEIYSLKAQIEFPSTSFVLIRLLFVSQDPSRYQMFPYRRRLFILYFIHLFHPISFHLRFGKWNSFRQLMHRYV